MRASLAEQANLLHRADSSVGRHSPPYERPARLPKLKRPVDSCVHRPDRFFTQ